MMSVNLTRPNLAMARTTVRSGDEIVVPRARSILRDVVAPWATLVGGAAAVASIVVQITRR